MQNLISFQEYAIKFNVSSTKKVLLPFQKTPLKKNKKPHYLINSEFYQKSALNKKIFKIKFPIRSVKSNLMYLQLISVNQSLSRQIAIGEK